MKLRKIFLECYCVAMRSQSGVRKLNPKQEWQNEGCLFVCLDLYFELNGHNTINIP